MSRVVLLVVALALAACSPTVAPPPGVVRFSIAADPAGLDPLRIHSDISSVELQLVRLSYEPFIDFDAQGRPFPVLLARIPSRTNGDIADDGRTLRYRLRPDVRWSDGSVVTSADVVFSLHRLMHTAGAASGYGLIARVEAPDAHTVIVRLRRPWAPAVLSFFTYGIEPAFVAPASGGGAQQLVDGPFRLVQWTRGEGLRYRANERYWRGMPAVRQIDVTIVPSPQTAMLLLRTGRSTWGIVPPSLRSSLANSGLRFAQTPGPTISAIVFNLRGPLRDRPLRIAIAASLDRSGIAHRAGFGAYPPLDTLQPMRSPLRDPQVREVPFEPRRADAFFDQAGYHRALDGVRRRRGLPLRLRYAFSAESPTAVQIATLIQAALRDRGVLLDLIPYTTAHLYEPTPSGPLHAGRFDLAFVTWPMGADGGDADLLTCHGGANITGYCDPTLDALEQRALALNDLRSRRAVSSRIEAQVARDLPILVLLENDYVYAYRPALRGFMPNGFVPTWNSARWRD
ncbi:MAG TPA: ABC transporter substrate-binding protein [Candidatus Acidoferrum sp.]|nr:ABC transporter substrate-binding protein [Candidatus Acidoferrum sp.]